MLTQARCRSLPLLTKDCQTCCTLGKREETSSTMNTAPGAAAAIDAGRWLASESEGKSELEMGVEMGMEMGS